MLRGKVYATLVICIAFFMSGGVSQAVGETFAPEVIEVRAPEVVGVTEPEVVGVTEPEFAEQWVDPADGMTKWGGKPPSVEWIMCGPSNGLPTPKVCLFVGQ